MFRMLVHSSSGVCECVWVYCSGLMCVGVAVWFGWGGVVSLYRLKQCLFNAQHVSNVSTYKWRMLVSAVMNLRVP